MSSISKCHITIAILPANVEFLMGPKEQRREELLNVNPQMAGASSSANLMAIFVLKDTGRFEHGHEITLKFTYTKKVEQPQKGSFSINRHTGYLFSSYFS